MTLAAAAMAAKGIPTGLGTGSPYPRHPTVQAAEACALDELSGGRFIMGMGAGKTATMLRKFSIGAATPSEVAETLQKLIDAGINLPLMEMTDAKRWARQRG